MQQTSKQALAASRIAATVEAAKPVKIGNSFVLDFSSKPKRRFTGQRHIKSNQRQAIVCILLTVAFLLLYYYGFELSSLLCCTLAQRVSSKSSTRFKNCGITDTYSTIFLVCCTNVTLMGPWDLSRIKCILCGMHLQPQHKPKVRRHSAALPNVGRGHTVALISHYNNIFTKQQRKYFRFYLNQQLYYSKTIAQTR